MSETTAIHCIIHGRVQGVGYRAWTGGVARKLGLKGWVRNRNEGTVEAVFIGEKKTIEQMLKHCQTGPMNARVEKIEQAPWDDLTPADFRQLPTA